MTRDYQWALECWREARAKYLAGRPTLRRAPARILVNAEPTEAMKMAGVNAIIDVGLDGPDGVGMEDAAAVWRAMTNAVLSQSPEKGIPE